jgi:hypothetical protein
LYNDELNFTSVVSPGTVTSTITKSDGTTESASTSQTVTTNSKNSIKYSYNPSDTGNVFTRYMLDSGSDFIGLAENDTVQVSLFVEEITSGVTLKLLLNDNYTALSDEADISSVGFHSVTLTRNSTSGTEDNLQFKSLGLDADVTISVKDIKASRIARNGFVETWYDQSSNGIDMSQGTADTQPSIVKNGGQVKSSNNLPSITFADDGVHLERAEFLTGQLGGYFIVGNTLKADQDGTDAQVLLRQGNNYRIAIELINAGNIRSFLRDNNADSADARTSSATVGDDEVFLNTTIITARGSTGLANYFNGGDESTANTTDVEDTNFSVADGGNIAIGSLTNGTFDYKGEMMEVILFNTNISSERTTIETEINNHYNIY